MLLTDLLLLCGAALIQPQVQTYPGPQSLTCPQVLPCYLTINTDLSSPVRLKPVERLSPMLSPSDFETKLERKKSQSGQVTALSDQLYT